MNTSIAALAATLAALAATAPVVAKDTAVLAGHIVDGTSAMLRGPTTIVIRDDRIVSVKDGYGAPAGATVIDLKDRTSCSSRARSS